MTKVEAIFNFVIIILVLIFAVSMAHGVNLKKWYGWVQVLLGFVLGYFMGSGQNLITAVFFALLVIWLGPIVWRRRHP